MARKYKTRTEAVEAGRRTAVRHIAGKVWEFRSSGYLQRAEFTFLPDGTAVIGDRLAHVHRARLLSTGDMAGVGFVVTDAPEYLETVTGRAAMDRAIRRHRAPGYVVDASYKWDRFTS